VLELCEKAVKSGISQTVPEGYWLLATMAEAWLGLGDKDKSDAYLAQASQLDPKPAAWMIESTQEQLLKLHSFLVSKTESPVRP
jgi:hypothetical protein